MSNFIEPKMVDIPDTDYSIGKYQVTFEEYDLFCEDTSIEKPYDEDWGRERRPVINVTWNDAKEYCKWLSKKTKENYRLPTEAEWLSMFKTKEYKWGFGDDESKLIEYAWYKENSNNKTHVVGSKCPINGIYDIHGNVWEWCEDWYEYKITKILRGSSWENTSSYTQTNICNYENPSACGGNIGFRLLKDNKSQINNGGNTDYYKLDSSWKDCQDIIENRAMNFAQGNIFKVAFTFNIGRHIGTSYERELNKIMWFAERELKRIKEMNARDIR